MGFWGFGNKLINMSKQEESKDPFFGIHSVIFNKLRNKKKKLNKIKKKE